MPDDCPFSTIVHRAALSLILGLLFVLSAHAQKATAPNDTVTVSLETALQRALHVSPEVDQREAEQHFAEARSDQARASRFLTEFHVTTAHAAAPGLHIPENNPVPREALYLNPDVRNDWEDLRPFNRIEFETLQPIWTWGQLSGNMQAARHGIAVEAARVRAMELEVARRTGEIYYNVLMAEALFRVAEEAGDVVEQAQREVQRMLDEGAEDVDDADLYQVQLTEQEYQRRVVEVTQRRQTARTALRRQLFVTEDTLLMPDETVLQPIDFSLDSLETYMDRALAHRPELEQARAGLRARNAQVDVARSDYYPKLFLSVSGGASYAAGRYRQRNAYIGDPFNGRSLRAGFGFRQNLNFLQTRAQVEQAEAQRDEVRHQQEGARQLVLFEVEEAYRNVITAQSALEAQEASLQISREWLRTEQVNFDLDLGDTENLVDAVQANLELQASYYESVRNYNVAVLDLLEATGTLVQRIESGMLVDE